MSHEPHLLIADDFDPAPSRHRTTQVRATDAAGSVSAIGYAVTSDGDLPDALGPDGLGLDRDALAAAGFTGERGQVQTVPRAGAPLAVLAGVGASGSLSVADVRDVAASISRAAGSAATLATTLLDAAAHLDTDEAVTALVEGAVLARYRYTALKADPKTTWLETLELIGAADVDDAAARGLALASATMLARDLANTPPAHLTATRLADLAAELGPQHGLTVTVFGPEEIEDLGCGGLLGVNAGSVREPRIVRLQYVPQGEASGHLGLVGKGIMYDSGGLSLKPGNGMHATMKMDMSGAASVLASMLSLRDLGCTSTVTGFLMCTDNLPSGSAIALGEVLHMRSGTTVEVKNTDAEGRLVLADGLALARDEGVDAVVNIATLTGAAMRALGTRTAAVFGTDEALVDRVRDASQTTDEGVWQLPLERRYRDQLKSDVADLSNVSGGANAGATAAALFLSEFVGDTPWAHLDIAGTMASDSDEAWRSKGATGFGTRLLAELAAGFDSSAL